jgi:hypothetical protein
MATAPEPQQPPAAPGAAGPYGRTDPGPDRTGRQPAGVPARHRRASGQLLIPEALAEQNFFVMAAMPRRWRSGHDGCTSSTAPAAPRSGREAGGSARSANPCSSVHRGCGSPFLCVGAKADPTISPTTFPTHIPVKSGHAVQHRTRLVGLAAHRHQRHSSKNDRHSRLAAADCSVSEGRRDP